MDMELKNTVIGIELGSTRIKAVLMGKDHKVLSQGAFTWENSFVDGIWTYSLDEVREGIRKCFSELRKDFEKTYGQKLTTTGAIGISAMMHGYLPFDRDDKQLVPFRTWRNTMTGEAAEKLTEMFSFNIPQRWSVAHLYQAFLNGEEHTGRIAYITTLAGYVHYVLTGRKVVGIGEASGMFPIDPEKPEYNKKMAEIMRRETGIDILSYLPEVLVAGEDAGTLTSEGARYLDPTGEFESGIRVVPPEGDAGTGMVATDSVREHTGNVSAGTSDFAMVVLDKELGVHKEVGIVTTPAGKPVAMVHCTNCTSDINAWIELIRESMECFGVGVDTNTLYTTLFSKALEGDAESGDLLSYNYYSGEGVTGFDEGRLLFIRKPDSVFNLANFMKTHFMSSLATLKIGMDILRNEENVTVNNINGHGGFFKTPGVGQRFLSAAIDANVSVMETAGEGGPYGMALLCAYALWRDHGETLEDYLDNKVFRDVKRTTLKVSEEEVASFNRFIEKYKKGLEIERKAIERF